MNQSYYYLLDIAHFTSDNSICMSKKEFHSIVRIICKFVKWEIKVNTKNGISSQIMIWKRHLICFILADMSIVFL